MYRAFDKDKANVTHNIQMQLQRNGGGTGWTRGLVNSFLMRNGLPIYAAGSGYNPEWENQGIKLLSRIVTLVSRYSPRWMVL